ncbi:Dabb family protein [Croceitalea rosinachiae]|uniref:Dabb family protein n=1 Tax=Croceitalea rosinachiae TaxID=3075596 RepID=A0ABU3AAC8_9FLAO|nr:Dabb family protein [Croceitalea sp. F388]MDT0606497.1 Dabb family protein [Croceitalea sp. F388]
MKKLLGAVLGVILLISCMDTKEKVVVEKEVKSEEMKEEKLLRHVVIFKFNDSTSTEQVEKLNKSFADLTNHIDIIQDFEWGLNDSPEDFHQGFTHCYLLTFKSEEDRDSIYTPHPKHQEFVASLGPHIEKVFVVDYWAN